MSAPPAPVMQSCPAHPGCGLQWMNAYPNGTFTCNRCRQGIQQPSWHCMQHQFDICHACLAISQQPPAPAFAAVGVKLFEYMDEPSIRTELIDRYPRIADNDPVFAIHAKSMVIDDETVFIGTFNLDPRSANLNTEVGVLIESRELSRQVSESIERDMLPGNSWQTTVDFNPDFMVSRGKRLKTWFNRILPMEPVL